MSRLKSSLLSLIAGALSLAQSGCVSYEVPVENFDFPEKRECNLAERIIPFDKVYRIPEALGVGVVGTGFVTLFNSDENGLVEDPLFTTGRLAKGLFNNVVDTALNFVSWIPLEIYEGFSGKTWEGPYLPLTKSMVEEAVDEARRENKWY